MCTHLFVNSGYSTICEHCGVERLCYQIETVSGYTLNQPLWIGYNRANRFRKMVLALCKPLTHSRIPGKMTLHLQSKVFDTMDELYEDMKAAICSDKGYNAMHLYAFTYLKNYEKKRSPTPKIIADLVGDFILIELGHKQYYPKKRFFSYRWILRALLKHRKLDFWTRYVKPLKNKSSNRRYQKMYDHIMTASTREPTQDRAVTIGKPPGQQQGDEPQSQIPSSCGLRPSKSGSLRRTRGGLYPKQCGLLDTASRQAIRVVFLDSTLQQLYDSQVQQECPLSAAVLSAN